VAFLELGATELEEGFISRAESSFLSSISNALKFLENPSGLRGIGWKIITDATFYLSQVSSFHSEEAVLASLRQVRALLPTEIPRLKDILPLPTLESPINGADALKISIMSAEYRLSLSATSSDASAWYDLGMGLHTMSVQERTTPPAEAFLSLVVSCLTSAVKHEPGNPSFWSALGTAYFATNPRAAQHCFVKALEIDSKDATVWCNLGMLYYFHEDVELAMEALRKAQVLDPDCAMAWVGQGLIASAGGNEKSARALFEHAVSLDHPLVRALKILLISPELTM